MQYKTQTARELVVLGMAMAAPKRSWVADYRDAIECSSPANMGSLLTSESLSALIDQHPGRIATLMSSLGVTGPGGSPHDGRIADLVALTVDVQAERIMRTMVGSTRFYANVLGGDLMKIEEHRKRSADAVQRLRPKAAR